MSEPGRRGRWAWLWSLVMVASSLEACGLASPDSDDGVRHYVSADRAIVGIAVEGQPAGGEHVAVQWPPEPPPSESARWQAVALPDIEPGSNGERDGRWVPEVAWYRLKWPPVGQPGAAVTESPVALYVPRALGLGVQVWRHDGSRWLPMFDNSPDSADQWNRPLLVTVPTEAAATSRGVTLAVGVPFRAGRNAVSSMWVGPQEIVRARADLRRALQLGIPSSATMSMVVLGFLSFGVWLGWRREPAYVWFALACWLWSLRNLHHFVDLPTSSGAGQVFWWLTNSSISWVMLAMYQFAFCFDRRRYARVVYAFAAINIVAMTAAGLVDDSHVPLLQHAVNIAASLFVTALLTWLAVRGGSRELRVITIALWVSTGFGVHDWLLLNLIVSPESIYLLPYASVLLICSFLYAGMRRFVGAMEQVENANAVLASRLDEREREVKANHEKLRRVEQEQAVLLERQRIMRDMHDGVGSTLISTLRVFEQGNLTSEGVTDVLRGAVDDLRMSIDSLEPIEHDLTTLLATMRLRMGRRIEGAGLRLQWDMADLPPLPWLDSPQAVQVLRLLQEALSNVIQHAMAGAVRISASVDEGFVKVEVADDGIGIDPMSPSNGQGLANMRHRARSLGGRLDVAANAPQGTVVSLWLPLRRRDELALAAVSC